ncbi:carbon-nitrogen hydrolase family protein [Enterovibrio sp. ZSDZ35]|uniref:Carbon-nitrogen hydrolase family protein n=1 Tax=Enterovibrio qingdaonensis TaxID=2899818 RepID=A0ABT5QJ93_9GAMM|nr:carbon-nitrogen hydrolase family protein [Enterovibrio sp. ZSDZ35]MDD1781061.1 carbon-nitrogen hydrolase family protein [Enterovibrio sp. ZSDZ35]
MSNAKLSIALCQFTPSKGDIHANFTKHKCLAQKAADHGADIVVFPELSLTGYEPALLEDNALAARSDMEHDLGQLAKVLNVMLIAGAPLQNDAGKPFIGAIIARADGQTSTYAKQYLHSGEEAFAAAGEGGCFISINDVKVALAICADFTHPQHHDDAVAENADVYLVSALISEGGFDADAKTLSEIAVKTQMPVLLSNFVGESGGWQTGGRSGMWDTDGQQTVLASSTCEGLALCELTRVSSVAGEFIAL